MPAHEEYAQQIADYAAARLTGDDLRRLEEHLAECADCAEVASAWKRLAPAIQKDGDRLMSPHPGVQELAEYALGTGAPADFGIARHLASCATCELEVAGWRMKQAEERFRHRRAAALAAGSAPYRTRIGSLIASRHSLSLAAGLVIGVGLAILLRPPAHPGAAPSEAESPVGAPAGIGLRSGPAPMLVLAQLRGGSGTATLQLAADAAFTVLAVQPIVSDDASADDVYRCQIVGSSGSAPWSAEVTVARIRAELERNAMIAFAVPAAALRAGRHRMICGPARPSPDQPPALEIPFEVAR
jgi:hypothetical protein